MKIKINGQIKDLDFDISIFDLMHQYKLNKEAVVVELNRKIYRKDELDVINLNDGDELEFISFFGGG